ncbi:low-complexity protein [Leptolyngbya sp. Heron Island J]|uniref:pentapeptide repeat-containing protein n=1 Tax=Leptolyngbya sp. Heron Island J TaxID=1385935 RepID=UPI0003B960EC|nr:pentapeptide repeat-containing protein [Leptolyngbya sp. Heron Island J]ESA32767.1 low-complexity protein [Leptolyngbya sp. Heron Island J]
MFEILIDADMLLDALLNRVWDKDDPLDIWEILKFSQIQGYLTDIGFNRIIDIIRKLQNTNAAEVAALAIQSRVMICDTSGECLHAARQIQTSDYESAVEVICCMKNSLGAIITHRPQDFDCNDTSTLSVKELLARQNLEEVLTSKVFILSGNNFHMRKLGQTLQDRYLQKIEELNTASSFLPFQGLSLYGVDLSGQHLEGMDFACARMASSNLARAFLHQANFSKSNLYEANLNHANLENVDFEGACLVHANLFSANLKYSRAENSDFRYANLKQANLDCVNWDGAKLRRVNMSQASLKHSFFNDANFDQSMLDDACLVGATLFGSTFQNASLRNANLQSANLKYVDFQGADLSGACFRNCNLEGTDFRDANLDYADFSETDLTRARFSCPLLTMVIKEKKLIPEAISLN